MSLSHESLHQRALERVGRTIRDKYRLDTLLGLGGMAAVYAATHRNGNRGAIKMLHEHLSVDDYARRLVRREGLLANRVQHRGAVEVLDDDVADDGSAFLVMPLLRGGSLHGRWERQGRKLPVREVLSI